MDNTILVTDINLEKACRVCLEEPEDMHSIFSELAHEENFQETSFIYEILMGISNMKIVVDDGLPNLICTKCLEQAHSCFKFQLKCNRSQLLMENYFTQLNDLNLSSEVKETPEENLNSLFLPESEFNPQIDIENNFNVDLMEEFYDDKNSSHGEEEEGELNKEICKSESDTYSYRTKMNAKGEKVFECDLCNKTYKFRNGIKIHLAGHAGKKPHTCNICKKSFTQHTSLNCHLRSHTGECPYSCKICGKRYKQSGTLTAHMRVHTGHRPFLCSICGKGFRQAPDLTYHMRTHTKEKPYMCNICGKTMAMQCHLVQHMRTHTGERPYKCEHCSKAFPSTTRLKRHTIIHTGLKPFICEVCKKSFNRASSLKVHAKIHTDERPHVCPVCGKRFIQAHTLKGHVLTHSTSTGN